MSKIPRVLFTAPSSGTGKTMITCGILQALKNMNYSPAAFKCGPDYIDPMFHRQVLGIDSYNLDTFLCGKSSIRKILCSHGKNHDLAVIEGVMGYYDGIAGLSTDASAYDVADATDTPTVLIIDCKGASVSIAAVIQGFLEYRMPSHVAGVILNRLSPMMYPRMKSLIEEQLGIRVYGYVPVLDMDMFQSRYLGLKMPDEIREIREKLEVLGSRIAETVDLDGIIELAGQAREIPEVWEKKNSEEDRNLKKELCFKKERNLPMRIAVARDEAFCFFYRDNLELLEEFGMELVYVSPIHDTSLPEDICGLLLYGGYPELYAEKLSANTAMKEEIRHVLKNGLPCIAECGGFMYLQQEIEDESGTAYPMVQLLPGRSYKTRSLRRFGYVTLSEGTVFGQEVGEIPAHEFHYYESEECGEAFAAKKPLSERQWRCMVSTDTLFAGYPHIHYLGNPKVAEAFYRACVKYRQERGDRDGVSRSIEK